MHLCTTFICYLLGLFRLELLQRQSQSVFSKILLSLEQYRKQYLNLISNIGNVLR